MGDVVDLPVVTRLDLEPKRVLAAAGKVDLATVIVIGLEANGDEYFASSEPDAGNVLWLLERMKLKLLRIAD